jgi:ubiquinone/menaquinone biosynthesis C-methylase UbiE
LEEKIKEFMSENLWNSAVKFWLEFNNLGKNVHRDFLNLPAFINTLPKSREYEYGLEIGGGEGTLARKLHELGYRFISTDLSPRMIEEAKRNELQNPRGIQYSVENGESLSFPDNNFDFALAFMCLMDMSYPDRCFSEIYRVLKPGGYFQFSIIHPCFASPPHRKHVYNDKGEKKGVEIGKYNEESMYPIKWNYPPHPEFTSFQHHLTISHWLMLGVKAGFSLEYLEEHYATPTIVKECDHLKHTITVPDNFLVRFRKN